MKKEIIKKIKEVLADRHDIAFSYLFGSFLREDKFNDIDIAIYLSDGLTNPYEVTSDIKISLSKAIDLSPDIFDIVLINFLLNSDRLDSLLILGEIFDGLLIKDENPSLRIEIIEKTSAQFRESEGIIFEAYR